MRSRLLTTLLGIGVFGLVACGNGAPTASSGPATGGTGNAPGTAAATGITGTTTVKVSATPALKFDPATISVKTGDVIQWTDSGSVPHNVTFDAYSSITSGTLQQGDTWEVKFTQPGTYQYHCTIHPGMDGTITVS